MQKFKFRLQTLLDQRLAKEDNLLRELGVLRQEEADELMRLSELKAQILRSVSTMETMLEKNTSHIEIARMDEYSKALRDDAKIQELTIDAVRERVEAKRNELVEAMKDRKVLDAYREKQEKEYMQAFLRAEQNEMDEMASVRYARGM